MAKCWRYGRIVKWIKCYSYILTKFTSVFQRAIIIYYFICYIEIIKRNIKHFPRIFETSGLNKINVAWMKQKRSAYQKVAHSHSLLSNIMKETISRLTFIWLSRLSSFAHFMPCTLKPQMMLLLLSRIMSISVKWVKV